MKINIEKILGYTIYAIGIIGGVEGMMKKSAAISAIAIAVIVAGSLLLGRKE